MIPGTEEKTTKKIKFEEIDSVVGTENEGMCFSISDNVQTWVNNNKFSVSSCTKDDNVSNNFDDCDYIELLPLKEQCINSWDTYEINEERATSSASKRSSEIKVNKN